ncbi:hypothetical protein VTK56DRAFT_6425 [Thermocarpiscus australiensis]
MSRRGRNHCTDYTDIRLGPAAGVRSRSDPHFTDLSARPGSEPTRAGRRAVDQSCPGDPPRRSSMWPLQPYNIYMGGQAPWILPYGSFNAMRGVTSMIRLHGWEDLPPAKAYKVLNPMHSVKCQVKPCKTNLSTCKCCAGGAGCRCSCPHPGVRGVFLSEAGPWQSTEGTPRGQRVEGRHHDGVATEHSGACLARGAKESPRLAPRPRTP